MVDHIPSENIPDAWEQKGRNVTSAAFFALLAIGVMYFYGQAIFVWILVVAEKMFSGHPAASDKTSQLSSTSVQSLRLMLFFSQYLIMLLPSWLLVRRWHSPSIRPYVRFKPTSPVLVLLSVLGTVTLLPISIAISSMMVRKIGIPEEILSANNSLVTSYTPVEFVWVLVVVALTPALCEEFFFRGHFQRTLERSMGWKSVLIAGIIFGLFHFQPLGLMSLSILGLFFGYVYYRSQSILTSMAAHFTNNAIVLMFDYRPHEQSQTYWDITQHLSPVLLIVSSIMAVGIIAVFHRMTKKAETLPEEIEQKETIPLAMPSPPVLAEASSADLPGTIEIIKKPRTRKSKKPAKKTLSKKTQTKRPRTSPQRKRLRPVRKVRKTNPSKRTKKN